LPGITRASVIELAKDEGVTVTERRISIKELAKKAVECFVTGTAAGITPIESITWGGKEIVFNDRAPGELGKRLQARLKGIQYGTLDDTHNWNIKV
jgi:branched-chain amino acid aminotransferase